MKEENQKLLSENKWCCIITEYLEDGSEFERGRIYFLDKLSNDEMRALFKKQSAYIEWENTLSEYSKHKPVKTYLQFRLCEIKYNDELEEFIVDYENVFCEMGEEIKGHFFAGERED